jgi:ketosteroid isomerase-like protein
MTTTAPAATAGHHPFTAALASRDIDALVGSLAPDAVLHSAVTNVPFEGREVLRDLYGSLFDAFEDLRVTDELERGDTRVFFWEGRMDGRYVAGADRLRLDADGKVREITIVGRPLTGLVSFLTGIGFHFTRRRRGALVARVLRLGTLPLVPLFRLIDALTGWIVRGRA